MLNTKVLLAVLTLSLSSACSTGAKKPESASQPVAAAPAPKMETKEIARTDRSGNTLVCVQGKDRRTILISKKETAGCEVRYKKFEQDAQVADATNTPSICSDVQQKIRNNLEKGQFTCSGETS